MADTLEREYQKWLRKWYRGWTTSVEYGLGGDDGFPDMVFGDDQFPVWWDGKSYDMASIGGVGYPYFVEIKRGKLLNGRLFPDEVRTSQLIWHTNARAAGMRCAMFVGVPACGLGKGWMTFAVKSELMKDWKEGYDIGKTAFGLASGEGGYDMTQAIRAWLRANT